MIEIKLDTTVFQLVERYPQTKELLIELGLDGVANPLMLRTAGKKMTVKKGAKMKRIPWSDVTSLFEQHHFIFEEEDDNE